RQIYNITCGDVTWSVRSDLAEALGELDAPPVEPSAEVGAVAAAHCPGASGLRIDRGRRSTRGRCDAQHQVGLLHAARSQDAELVACVLGPAEKARRAVGGRGGTPAVSRFRARGH